MILARRSFLSGIIAAAAAPAIIRTPGLIMPVKQQLVTTRPFPPLYEKVWVADETWNPASPYPTTVQMLVAPGATIFSGDIVMLNGDGLVRALRDSPTDALIAPIRLGMAVSCSA